MKSITIQNCGLNNLKGINVSIPKNQLTVITGVSGSGKSSLAFDVVYAEGRQAYLQAIGIIPDIQTTAEIGEISGISPAVAVKQNIVREANPRSLVGSRSGLFDRLRNLLLLEGQVDTAYIKSADDMNFNSLRGMCLDCKGLGKVKELSIEKVIPDANVSLKQICSKLYTWTKKDGPQVFLQHHNIDENTPFKDLTEQQKDDFLHGFYDSVVGRYGGLFPYIKWRAGLDKSSESVKNKLFETIDCKRCHGYRIRQEAMQVTLKGLHIGQLGDMYIYELRDFLRDYIENCTEWAHVEQSPKEINALLNIIRNFMEVELGHLTLDREMRTLSGGELQRFQLMTYLQTETDSLVYVFDEPSHGLHELEKQKVIQKLVKLKDLGNTVVIVDHDRSVIEVAEYVIDVGPGAGKNGGEIIYQGSLQGLSASTESVTGAYLSGRLKLPTKKMKDYRAINEHSPKLTMQHVTIHNLKDVSVSIPLGVMVGIAGVSGSGKSSLVSSALLPALKNHFRSAIADDLADVVEASGSSATTVIDGFEFISGYAAVSQEPIGRNKRSTPVTYLKIWDDIRGFFARQLGAIKAGLGPEYFSFNSAGACPVCRGMGHNEKSLGIMGSIIGPCQECDGKRFRKEVLDVRYRGRNISDVLSMETAEAIEFFDELQTVSQMLRLLERTGMGYLTLGQPTPTLSGGEAQRVKLAKELGLSRSGNVLYILDEPTAGLSFYDTTKLMGLLNDLINNGNSVLVIEHDPAVLAYCDWLIELGPGGASYGGNIIAQGPPQTLMRDNDSLIGPFL